LVRRFGRPLRTSVSGLTHLFPRAEDLADVDLPPVVRDRECAKSLTVLARAVSRKEFTFEFSLTLQDAILRLSAICGMGEEAAHYLAMRVFGDPDAFPLNERDLDGSDGNASVVESWRPWRAYAAMHLWARDGAI
jgi:3-methyladenine DNA glycosylase/8-oxoguanine DNA glycosylase